MQIGGSATNAGGVCVDDRIGQVALPVIAGTTTVDHYVVLADISGTSGAKATITASKISAQLETESSAAHGPDAPQALGAISTTQARVLSADLTTATEQDAYKLSVGATDKIQLTAQSDVQGKVATGKYTLGARKLQ